MQLINTGEKRGLEFVESRGIRNKLTQNYKFSGYLSTRTNSTMELSLTLSKCVHSQYSWVQFTLADELLQVLIRFSSSG